VKKNISQQCAYCKADQDKYNILQPAGLKSKKNNSCNGNQANEKSTCKGINPDAVHWSTLKVTGFE
jgi:hypothetical protein